MTINGGKEFEYGEYLMKIEFNSGGDLPLNKQLKLHMLAIVVGSVFEEDSKYYAQIYLDECLHDL